MPLVDEVISVIVNETRIDAKTIKPSVRLNELGLSTCAPMRPLVSIEDHFSCEIDAADIYGVFAMSVGDIPSVIERTISAP